MDPGYRTPLVDFFRRGEVARDVRLLAARGALAPRAHEQLALIVLLLDDPDLEIARAATATLDRIPREPLAAFLARSDVSPEMREFFRARGIEPADTPAPDVEKPLIDTEADVPLPGADEEGAQRKRPLSLLPILDRLKLAMKGTREQRSVLVRDPNKLVTIAVLSCPKLTETEVESFARMGNVSDEVLRIIGTTRTWVKNYSVAAALAKNPKTPPAISVGLVSRLNERDVKMLAVDRNVSEPVRIAARKMVMTGESRRH